MADGMVEKKKGEACCEAARNSEGDRTHENQLKFGPMMTTARGNS